MSRVSYKVTIINLRNVVVVKQALALLKTQLKSPLSKRLEAALVCKNKRQQAQTQKKWEHAVHNFFYIFTSENTKI